MYILSERNGNRGKTAGAWTTGPFVQHKITRRAIRRKPADPRALGIPAEWLSAQGFLRTRPDFWPQSGGLDGFFAAGVLNRP